MSTEKDVIILAIESSCDDTSVAILKNKTVLANVTANQSVHEQYGGVVPELASRAHQQNIVPVTHTALQKANIDLHDIDAIGYTRGPGLMGSLLVGGSFAKGLALSLNKPLIEVNHMQAHILAHLIESEGQKNPTFPFLCLTVSGGHTQIVLVKSHDDMTILGETIDDAAGEAFDKAAKIMGLPYPGGPLIDKYAQLGNPLAFQFSEPKVDGLNFSFSGLKTSILYFLQKEMKKDDQFIEKNRDDICASIQHTIIEILMKKVREAVTLTGCSQIAIAGGVSANSGLRKALTDWANNDVRIQTFIPEFQFCTDNAGMIGINAYFKFLNENFGELNATSTARWKF